MLVRNDIVRNDIDIILRLSNVTDIK